MSFSFASLSFNGSQIPILLHFSHFFRLSVFILWIIVSGSRFMHKVNTLERLVNLQEEMATSFNNFLRVQPTRRKKQTC